MTDDDKKAEAVSNAINAFISIQMNHPGSSEHARETYKMANSAQLKLLEAFPQDSATDREADEDK